MIPAFGIAVKIIIGTGSSTVAYSMLAGRRHSDDMERRAVILVSLCVGLASSLITVLFPDEYFYPVLVSAALFFSTIGDAVLS